MLQGRKRPLRHLVSCSQELADTTFDGNLLLISDDDSFIWSGGSRAFCHRMCYPQIECSSNHRIAGDALGLESSYGLACNLADLAGVSC
jgi:hypothetical protein